MFGQHDLADEAGNGLTVEVGEREVVGGVLQHPDAGVFVRCFLESPLWAVVVDVHACTNFAVNTVFTQDSTVISSSTMHSYLFAIGTDSHLVYIDRKSTNPASRPAFLQQTFASITNHSVTSLGLDIAGLTRVPCEERRYELLLLDRLETDQSGQLVLLLTQLQPVTRHMTLEVTGHLTVCDVYTASYPLRIFPGSRVLLALVNSVARLQAEHKI